MSTLVLAVVLVAAPPPGAARAAGSEDLIVFGDNSSCEVRMQNVHASSTVADDASVAVNVDCHPPGATRAPLVVDEITAQTTISFSDTQPLPGFVDAEPIGTCAKIVMRNRPSATLPCHQPGGRAGYYVGRSTVTATLRGATESVQVARQDFIGPTA